MRRRVREALSTLRNYPTIQRFTRDLHLLVNRRPHTIFNPLLWTTGTALFPDKQLLLDLEKALRAFRATRMPRDLQSELRARLCSPVSGKCLSVLNELSAALALKSMPSKVRLYPNYPKKGPDISAELRSRPIFFELTSLGIGKTESKLLKVCRGVGKVLHRSHTPTSLLHVDIDSARLVWNRKGHLLVKQSIRKSVKLANDMRLRDIFDSFRSFHVLDPCGDVWRRRNR